MSGKEGRNNNLNKLQAMCEVKGADIHERLEIFLKSPIPERENLTDYLIGDGSDVDMKNRNENPPLATAISCNCIIATRALLQAGANHANSYFNRAHGPLHIAAENGFLDIVRLLIEYGVDVNARDDMRNTPLLGVSLVVAPALIRTIVPEMVRYEIIKVLIDAGADVNAVDSQGRTLLSHSVRYPKIFELLMSKGADIHVIDSRNRNVLFASIEDQQPKITKQLISLGADVTLIDKKGENLLHKAFAECDFEIAECLLDKGLAIDKVNHQGFDPLCKGIAYWIYITEISPLDYYDHTTYNDLCDSMFKDRFKLIDLAIERGANINNDTENELSPLYIVLQRHYHHSDIVKSLLSHGATFDFEHSIVLDVMNDPNKSKFSFLLLRQTALYAAQNRSDGPTNFDLNKLNEKPHKKDYARCCDELELMKTKKVGDTNVSFFDVLTKRDIGGYTRNESIVSAFETQDFSKSFPIYNDMMSDRFLKKLKTEKLVEKALEGLSHVLQWDKNSMQIILDKILSYFDKKDLEKLSDI